MLRFMPPPVDKKKRKGGGGGRDDEDEVVDDGEDNLNEKIDGNYGPQVKLALSRLPERELSFELIEVSSFCRPLRRCHSHHFLVGVAASYPVARRQGIDSCIFARLERHFRAAKVPRTASYFW